MQYKSEVISAASDVELMLEINRMLMIEAELGWKFHSIVRGWANYTMIIMYENTKFNPASPTP